MAKGSGLLIALGEKPKGDAEAEPMEPDSDDSSEYDTEAKTNLAQKFFEAASSGDFEKAGMVMEKFVHFCTGV